MIVGSIVIIFLVSMGIFANNYAKYQNIKDIKLVEENINYKSDYKMMAMYKSDDGTNYTEIDTMPESVYVINESKSYCTVDNNTQVKGKLKTINGIHSVTGLKKNEKCYIWFDKKSPENIDELIATLNPKTETPNFKVAATTDEGVYTVSDGMYGGNSYYWRGAATTNYVKFAGKCWRIVRINGDKTMRLIYDGATCHANGTSTTDSLAVANVSYNPNYSQSEYVGWKYTSGAQRPSSITSGTNAPIKTTLENWYNSNIGNNTTYSSNIADGKYCNDRNTKSGQSWASAPSNTFYYAAYERTIEKFAPTLSCAALDTYSLKVGLITADEAEFAGGTGSDNKQYYLYNGQNYWTMSPHYWDGFSDWTYMFAVLSNGSFRWADVDWNGPGVRPVINLKANVQISSGDGTKDNPYIVAN